MSAVTTTSPVAAAPLPASSHWSRTRWLATLLLTFTGQIGLICLLGTGQPIKPTQSDPTPPLYLAEELNNPLAELISPVVFIFPNTHGFSGAAWDMTPRREFQARDWTEPLRWLPPEPEQLGDTFKQLLAATKAAPVQAAEKIAPSITPLETSQTFLMPSQSTLRVEGSLAGRTLRSTPMLPAWPSDDLIKPSAVRVIVDAKGDVISATLQASSDLKEADTRALEMSWNARFEPLTESVSGLTWGRLVFIWRTVPIPAANAPTSPRNTP